MNGSSGAYDCRPAGRTRTVFSAEQGAATGSWPFPGSGTVGLSGRGWHTDALTVFDPGTALPKARIRWRSAGSEKEKTAGVGFGVALCFATGNACSYAETPCCIIGLKLCASVA
jgi:hypothetical protein